MALLLAPATSLGAKEVARLEYVTDVFGSAAGIGSVGVTIALAIAVAGAVAGPLADRTEPRALLLVSLGALTLSNFATGGLLAQGLLSAPLIIALAAVDGLALGMGAPALVKVLAAMVPVDARGSAEIVNIFRLSAGGIAGLLLANASPSVVVTMLGCGIGTTLGAAGVAVLVKPTRSVRPLATGGPGSTSLLATLRDMPSLRYVVIADLVLTFTIPTQMSNVILVDDVLFSGRTLKAALSELFDHGRPAKVELAVLVDRGGRKLPVAADYTGLLLDATPTEKVVVRLDQTSPEHDFIRIENGARKPQPSKRNS